MASLGWLVSFLVFLGVEMAFCCLTSLWFAVGALGAFAVALTGGSMEQQLAGFVAGQLHFHHDTTEAERVRQFLVQRLRDRGYYR